jgi:hypothetical protein
MYPTVELISVIACIIICVALMAFAVSYKKRLDGSALCVYAQVTHRWDPSNAQPAGFREHIYRVFAKWTDQQILAQDLGYTYLHSSLAGKIGKYVEKGQKAGTRR